MRLSPCPALGLACALIFAAASARAEAPELVVQSGHGQSSITSLAFQPQGQLLASADAQGLVIVWDLRTLRKLRAITAHTHEATVAFSPDGGVLATESRDATILWDVRTGAALRRLPGTQAGVGEGLAWSSDGKLFARQADLGVQLHRTDDWSETRLVPGQRGHFQPGTHVLATVLDKEVVLLDADDGRELRRLQGHAQRLRSFAFSASGKRIATSSFDGTARAWDTETGKELDQVAIQYVSSVAIGADDRSLVAGDGSKLHVIDVQGTTKRSIEGHGPQLMALAPRGDIVAVVGSTNIELCDLQSGVYFASLSGSIELSRQVAFFQDRLFVSELGEVKAWNLGTLQPVRRYQGGHLFALDPRGRWLLTTSAMNDDAVSVQDLATAAEVASLKPGLMVIKSIAVLPDGGAAIVAGIGKRGSAVTAHALPSGKQLWSLPLKGTVLGAALSADGRRLAVVDHDGNVETVRLYELPSRKQLRALRGDATLVLSAWATRELSFTPDGKHLLLGSFRDLRDMVTVAFEVATGKRTLEVPSPHGFAVRPDGKVLVAGEALQVFDPATGTELGKLPLPAGLAVPAIDADGRLFASAHPDGGVSLYRPGDAKEQLRLVSANFQRSALQGGTFTQDRSLFLEYVVARGDGEYMASRDATQLVGFRKDGRAYRFEQFDMRLNRPDRVLATLGRAPAELIRTYAAARAQRLRKAGVTEAQLSDAVAPPELERVGAAPPRVTTERKLKLRVRVTDPQAVSGLEVYDNGVPVAVPAVPPGQKSLEIPVSIELTAGLNRIRIVGLGAQRAESLALAFDVQLQASVSSRRTYLVAVGVSAYRDAQYALRYAAKDARDLAAAIAARLDTRDELRTLLLLDGDATREKVLAARAFLAGARVDDQVVLFFAGHGLLDDQDHYWFATPDIDFEKPALRGLAYEDMEALLTGTSARRKLLLMDTCHAGEVDRDDKTAPASELVVREVGARSSKVSSARPRSTDYLRQLFTDLRRGSGAAVIAAAGGAEFSLEGKGGVANGVFTHALLEGVATFHADRNADLHLTVSELRDFVGKRVEALTGGQQRPTFRRENVEYDFVLF